VSVTCRDLGIMAATLANRGINPVTGKQAIRGEYVESVLGVMSSCGMYDFAGEWIFKVGLPAKSGVAGGVIAVLPGQLGIGVFSPRLDDHGNSVRGIRVCQELSRHFDLHLFSRPAVGRSTIRLKFTGAELSSSRIRTAAEAETLRENGHRIVTYQLQGHLSFSTAEVLVRDIMDELGSFRHLLVDLKRVLSVNESASRLLYQLVVGLDESGHAIVFTHSGHLPALRRYMKLKLGEEFAERFVTFESNDLALEWCENQLLESLLPGHPVPEVVDPAHYDLLQGLAEGELATLVPMMEKKSYPAGTTIIQIGADAREIFFLARGNVSVMLPGAKQPRLATFSPGMSFGEMAFIDGAPRSAMIVADTDVTCHLLAVDHFQRLGASHPSIKIKLLEQISQDLCRKLRKANRERSVLD
jgi:glutaminase